MRTPRDDPTGLALFAFPEGQRIEPVVSDTNRERRQKAQDNDCGSRAQVANCPVAAGDHRRGSGWRRITSSVSGNWEKTSSWKLTKASSVSDDDPRWRSPEAGLGVDTGFENGSAASELRCRCAWLHHGSGPRARRIQGCGAIDPRPKAAPL